MKNKTRMLALVGGLALVAAAMVPAHAICPTARLITSDFGYIYTPGVCDGGYPCPGDSSTTDNLKGVYWVVGSGNPGVGGNDSGTFAARQADPYGYNIAGWLTNYPGYPGYLNGSWAQSQDIDGCPDFVAAPGSAGLCTAVMLTDQVGGSSYYMVQAGENDAQGNYRYSGGTLTSLDREDGGVTGMPGGPTISSSSRLGDTGVELTINPPDTAGVGGDAGCADVVAGYRVWSQVVPRDAPAPVDRAPAAGWVDVSGVVQNPATVTVSCAGNSDIYVSTSLVFDSNFETAFVSANSSKVECGPNAADVQDIRPRVRPGQEIELKRNKKGGRR